MRDWYLSFATKDEFLGAAVVQADDIVGAHLAVTLLGINPGGEVLLVAVPDGKADALPDEFRNVLLSRSDVETMDKIMIGSAS